MMLVVSGIGVFLELSNRGTVVLGRRRDRGEERPSRRVWSSTIGTLNIPLLGPLGVNGPRIFRAIQAPNSEPIALISFLFRVIAALTGRGRLGRSDPLLPALMMSWSRSAIGPHKILLSPGQFEIDAVRGNVTGNQACPTMDGLIIAASPM